MNFTNPSPFDGEKKGGMLWVAIPLCLFLELAILVMFFALYNETVGLMNDTYLSELPIVGSFFAMIDEEANASHIISLLLATFSVGTPIFLWSEIYRQNILENPQEWFSHPQNQVMASIAGLILALVVGLEVVNLYTLVAREAIDGPIFVEKAPDGIMAYLAQNKGLAIGVSFLMAIVNIVIAMLTTRLIHSLK